jgi:hypothetical protein
MPVAMATVAWNLRGMACIGCNGEDAAGCVFTSDLTSSFRLYTSYFNSRFHYQQIEPCGYIDGPGFALVIEFQQLLV